MKNWITELIFGTLLIIALLGLINNFLVNPEDKHKKIIKEKCEEVCFLNNSNDNYYKCCYEWEINK